MITPVIPYLVDAEAKETVRRLTAEFAKARGIDEKLKAIDSLRWVQEMNNCKGYCQVFFANSTLKK